MNEKEPKPSPAQEASATEAASATESQVEFPKQQWLCCNKACAERFTYNACDIFWYPEDKKWLCAECLKKLGLSSNNRMNLEQYFQRRGEEQDKQRDYEPAYRERKRLRTTGAIMSDRDDLMGFAVRMFESFQFRQATAHQQLNMEPNIELAGQEGEAYLAAMKYLTDEFKKGTTPSQFFNVTKEDYTSDPV